MALLQLFCFSASNAEDKYGYGTATEAEEYATALAPEYSACPVIPTASVDADRIAFSIREALAARREGDSG